MNKTDYFEYNGVRYYSGTKFTMKDPRHKANIVKAVFRGADTLFDDEFSIMYEYWDFRKTCQCFILVKPEDLPDKIVEILDGNYYTELEKSKQYIPDSKIPELVIGWMMYLFIMVGLTIFNDRWLGWIAASIYFFNWRKKIKEKNTYYTKKDI